MCMPNRLWIALVMILPAVADPAMTFKATNAFEVLAEGEITPDTPAAFTDFLKHNGTFRQTIMFNSLGGNLVAGLALGREIRSAGWNTTIGTPGLSSFVSNPGECSSACTFAYLGGRIRSITAGSKVGVHRFVGVQGDVEQITQQLAGALVAYIREMGVSTEMYALATQGTPQDAKYLDADTLTRLRITTREVVEVKMTDENGVSVVHLTDGDSGGTTYGHMDFYCNGPRLLARLYFPPPAIAFNSSQFTLEWVFSTLSNVADRQLIIPPAEYRYRGQDASQIWIDVNVTHALLENWIIPASSIGVRLIKTPGLALGAKQDRVGSVGTPLPGAFQTLVQTMERSCH
jgi:hypothetical protein